MTDRANRRQAREDSVLDVITKHNMSDTTVGLSFRDVAYKCDLPLSTVYELCETLRGEGKITFIDGIARSLRIVVQ